VEDIIEALNERLPAFARLERPSVVNALPRTALGKIDGAQLRAELRRRER
jgi:acyl-coenzyme A synthetase/AMP-(fatty) acid ligase